MICKNCNAEYEDFQKKCPVCNTPAEKIKKEKVMPTVMQVFAVISVVILVAYVFCFAFGIVNFTEMDYIFDQQNPGIFKTTEPETTTEAPQVEDTTEPDTEETWVTDENWDSQEIWEDDESWKTDEAWENESWEDDEQWVENQIEEEETTTKPTTTKPTTTKPTTTKPKTTKPTTTKPKTTKPTTEKETEGNLQSVQKPTANS